MISYNGISPGQFVCLGPLLRSNLLFLRVLENIVPIRIGIMTVRYLVSIDNFRLSSL